MSFAQDPSPRGPEPLQSGGSRAPRLAAALAALMLAVVALGAAWAGSEQISAEVDAAATVPMGGASR